MDRVNFFKNNLELQIEAYLQSTHAGYNKTNLNSINSILSHYADDISLEMTKVDQKEKAKLGVLKTSFSLSWQTIVTVLLCLSFFRKDDELNTSSISCRLHATYHFKVLGLSLASRLRAFS